MTSTEEALLAAYAALPQPTYRDMGGLTMSRLGGCRRQAAHLRAGTPPSDPDANGTSAAVGSAIHAALLPGIAAALGGACEVEVEYRGIRGTVDVVAADRTVELKTVTASFFDWLAGRDWELPLTWRMQTAAGALGAGRRTCDVLVLDRVSGRVQVVEVDADDELPELDDWLTQVEGYRDPGLAPRDGRGPGQSKVCDWCEYRSLTWPPRDDGADPQAVVLDREDGPAVEAALASYADARDRGRRADEDRDWWRSVLSATPDGAYGAWRLRWSDRVTQVLDGAEARRRLEQLGYPVPVTERKSRAIEVKRQKR